MTPEIIRAWAKSQGIKIGDRGRVSAEIRERYRTAHTLAGIASEAPAVAEALEKDREQRAELLAVVECIARGPGPASSEPVAKVPAPRAPRTKAKPDIRLEGLRVIGSVDLVKGDPMRVVGEQGNWRFLAVVIQPSSGKLYIDCVDPGGIGRAIAPERLDLPRKGVTRHDVRQTVEERTVSATAHAQKR